ncbi:TetR family transcriptional regulator [Promicromonospora sukumoe]|uniref:AcrR family transcriptional regulator n=1 Tax=Promicromonospora sukumoe TaxID=88382 RepID=A0A7W3J8V3_9MICO|nr:TetR family transcriptional regulator [Promicromonospora sukumoe]MBA8808415.1 AcrR family transcriptional regulator [Promicromonospora sukumoe]
MVASVNSRRRSRDDVAEMALRLLDEYGLPDLTMRHLATALGVQPSALYWHFPNKQALLAAVSELILAPMRETPADDLSVHEAVRLVGSRLRECLLAYRDGSELVSSSLALGLVSSPVRAQLLEVTRRHEVPDGQAEVAAEAVMHFVVGATFHEQQRLAADQLGLLAEPVAPGPDGARAGSGADGGDFAEALTMIAHGLEVSIAQDRSRGN